ncbi:hypothetical protein AMAG_12838 [Allomyces macrogynus ATCC 38327]|uniref:Uncharacterized protein n=1 Tax=Allomyces macrogynus (strain ATCC 38327) TaxID=578462 RepID=A0A0L0T274_ALLM3|nr:hypothetical protein AMAG_12838 [Allomyces macrogynus ATCC 38327]|eukprot:KNE68669.1 hypothetical protein AMAG_12838 [Allomyces macrogynus ATCC 38327]
MVRPCSWTAAWRRLAVLLVVALLFATLLAPVHAEWPQGHQRKALLSPGLIHLPTENKTFVLGGKIRMTATVTESITDVAIIDLNQAVSSNNISAQAVSTAPFSLLSPAYRLATFVVDNGNGVYEAWMWAGNNSTSIWRVPDLLSPKAALVSQPVKNQLPVVNFPGYISASEPRKPSEAATYFFGNTSASGQEVSAVGNDTLWRFDKDGITEVTPSSKTRPPGRGWSSLVQSGSTLVLTGAGPVGNDIWSFNTVSLAWTKRTTNLTSDRFDHASTIYTTPTGSRFIIIVGGSTGSAIEYFDADSAKDGVRESITGDGPRNLLGAASLFLHDSHLFLVGGLTGTGDSLSGLLLSIIKITPAPDGSALKFAWTPTYVPAKLVKDKGEDGGNSMSTGAIIGIVVGSIAFLAIVGVIKYILIRRRRQRKRARQLATDSAADDCDSLVTAVDPTPAEIIAAEQAVMANKTGGTMGGSELGTSTYFWDAAAGTGTRRPVSPLSPGEMYPPMTVPPMVSAPGYAAAVAVPSPGQYPVGPSSHSPYSSQARPQQQQQQQQQAGGPAPVRPHDDGPIYLA